MEPRKGFNVEIAFTSNPPFGTHMHTRMHDLVHFEQGGSSHMGLEEHVDE
jgi:hypothetical protein